MSTDAQELLQPILDLATGAEGGVGFVKLRHTYLPDWIRMAEEGDLAAQKAIEAVTIFSKICQTAMT